ncbi:efflux transporter outer membrane subunit [Methyloraptor flagellatus]|uniref:Efflux transporter outer membrane subunit n=1 Tax=Methyloraptor flagellatus TaxID=3162530 RepID=A0AAU7XAF3_9HYPH
MIGPVASSRNRRRQPRRLAAIMVSAGLLSACSDAPLPDLAPDVPKAYQWRGAGGTLPTKPDWWDSYRSSELSRLVRAADAQNLDIKAAVERIYEAEAQARIAGASLLPTLDFSGDASRARSNGIERGSFQTALSASYTLDFWGRNRATTLAAVESARASRFDAETVRLSTLTSVASAYFQLLAAQDRRAIAERNVAAATRVLTVIRQRLDAGTATALDVAQQESVLATQRATVPPLDQTIEQTRASLAVLIGRAPERSLIRGGSMAAVRLPSIEPGLPAELLVRRPDVASAEAQFAAAHQDVLAARAAFFPTLTLTAQGGYASTALTTLIRPDSAFYSLAAGLTQPVFEGGRLTGQKDYSEARERELVQTYRKTVLTALSDVEKALVAIRQLARQERLQRESLDAAQRAFQIAEQRLNEGTVDLVTVINTQQTLFNAQDTVTQVRLQRLQATIALYQALGGGWVRDPKVSAAADPLGVAR